MCGSNGNVIDWARHRQSNGAVPDSMVVFSPASRICWLVGNDALYSPHSLGGIETTVLGGTAGRDIPLAAYFWSKIACASVVTLVRPGSRSLESWERLSEYCLLRRGELRDGGGRLHRLALSYMMQTKERSRPVQFWSMLLFVS